MKTKRAKRIAFLFAITMLISSINVPVTAQENVTDTSKMISDIQSEYGSVDDIYQLHYYGGDTITIGNLKYTLATDENIACLTGYVDEPAGKLEIPESISYNANEYKVTSIAGRGDNDNDGVFYECSELEEIVLPAGLEEMQDITFIGCTSLKKVVFSEGITEMYYIGLRNDSVTTVSFPSTAKSIGRIDCPNLEEITIPKGVTKIFDYAFCDCYRLKKVDFLSDENDDKLVIGNYAFSGCQSLEEIAFPGNLESIGTSAFSGCQSLEEIAFPGNLESIGTSAFQRCTSINRIVLQEGLKSIGEDAFNESGVNGNNSISVNELTIPSSLEEVGHNAFKGCMVDVLTVTGSLDYLGQLKCRQLKISDNVTELTTAFDLCECKEIVIPSSVTEIDDSIFENSLHSKKLINESEVEISLPEDDYTCWLDGKYEEKIETLKKGTAICEYVHLGRADEVRYYYVVNDEDEVVLTGYEDESERNRTRFHIPSEFGVSHNVTRIVKGAFAEWEQLIEVSIPGNIKKLPDEAFKDCDNLRNIDISDGVEEIGEETFDGGEFEGRGGRSVYIPLSIKRISENAFEHEDYKYSVYYAGSEEQWKAIEGIDNCGLTVSDNYYYNYNPENNNDDNEDTPDPEDTTIPENEPHTSYKLLWKINYGAIYYDTSKIRSLSYNGKNHNKAEDYGLYIEYRGQSYTGNDIKIKAKNAKNVGVAYVQFKKLKGDKRSSRCFKGMSMPGFKIKPVTIKNIVTDKSQYSQDGDVILKQNKEGDIKKISVLFKNPKNGKIYSKSVPKDMWERNYYNEITFSGNFNGMVKY